MRIVSSYYLRSVVGAICRLTIGCPGQTQGLPALPFVSHRTPTLYSRRDSAGRGSPSTDGPYSKAQHCSDVPLREMTRVLTLSLRRVQKEASR